MSGHSRFNASNIVMVLNFLTVCMGFTLSILVLGKQPGNDDGVGIVRGTAVLLGSSVLAVRFVNIFSIPFMSTSQPEGKPLLQPGGLSQQVEGLSDRGDEEESYEQARMLSERISALDRQIYAFRSAYGVASLVNVIALVALLSGDITAVAPYVVAGTAEVTGVGISIFWGRREQALQALRPAHYRMTSTNSIAAPYSRSLP